MMDLFSKLFGRGSSESIEDAKHAVIVHFNYGQPSLDPLHALEGKLRAVVAQAEAGEYDGHEIAMDLSDGFLYMYGPEAYKLYAVVAPILEDSSFMIGATARLRFGPSEEVVHEELITIKPQSIS
jgi:hypothetical protein